MSIELTHHSLVCISNVPEDTVNSTTFATGGSKEGNLEDLGLVLMAALMECRSDGWKWARDGFDWSVAKP